MLNEKIWCFNKLRSTSLVNSKSLCPITHSTIPLECHKLNVLVQSWTIDEPLKKLFYLLLSPAQWKANSFLQELKLKTCIIFWLFSFICIQYLDYQKSHGHLLQDFLKPYYFSFSISVFTNQTYITHFTFLDYCEPHPCSFCFQLRSTFFIQLLE